MNLATWLERSAKLHPMRPAIALGSQVWCTYAQFAERAARTATWLLARGISVGDRVALFSANRPDYFETFWGVWWAGAVVVPINAKLHAREAAWIVQHSGARIVFTDEDHRTELSDALQELGCTAAVQCATAFSRDARVGLARMADRGESDPCWLFYTSGTTGRPKAVTLAPRQLRWMTLGYLGSVQAVEPGASMLHPAPLSHGGGMYHLPYVLNGGLNVVLESSGFDAAECLALAKHWGRASFFAAPTMVRRLVDVVRSTGNRPEGLESIVYGGGPMYLADIEEALSLIGQHFVQIYGQGECPMSISVLPKGVINDSSNPRYRERLASVGIPQSMVEISVRDKDGLPVSAGERGEICVRGDVVMQGYWADEEATASAISDGWLSTGDIGALDDEGFLTLLDRSKDMVVSGGTNIYPREVEEALLMHPDVKEAAVIGRPDPEWGEVVVACVVGKRTLDACMLDDHCLSHIARFKRPKHYHFMDALPKNSYGKVLKTALRELDLGDSK